MNFYDTCALLDLQQNAFESKFFISNITLAELERIKTSGTKDEEIKYAARQVLHLLDLHQDMYEVILYRTSYDEIIKENYLPLTADSQIIASALVLQSTRPNLIFVTNDLACKVLAESLGLNTSYKSSDNQEEYTGYVQIELDDEQSNKFYGDILVNNINYYNLLENQYLIVKYNNEITDKYKWAEGRYYKVPFYKIESKMFGKIVPKDTYQQLAMDSIHHNQFTMIKGPAGSGKDHIGLGYLFSLLERGKIDKIFIFVNPVATKGAAKLGYLPGDKNSKILDSQIGNFLIGKLGSLEVVYQMIEKDQLVLMPLSDIRGVDLSDTHAALYITEAQNMSVSMMKLALQRVGEDTLVIINGDTECQVDLNDYAGRNNGMKRASEIFKGQDYFGEVTLREIYRSKITKQADLM